MKKKKSGHEFFEVFRRVPENDKSRSWWSRKLQTPPPQAEAKTEPATPTPRRLAPARDTTTPPGRVALTFSREALAICAVALAGVIIGSYVWGYRRGVAAGHAALDPVAARQAVAQSAASPGSARPTTLSVSAPFYTLRIIKQIPAQRAKEIAADLRVKGYNAFVMNENNVYSVNVSQVADYGDADAKKLKEKFKAMVYRNQRCFDSCYWTRVDPGRIAQ